MAKQPNNSPSANNSAPNGEVPLQELTAEQKLAQAEADLEAYKAKLAETQAELEATTETLVELTKEDTKAAGTFTVDGQPFKVVAGGIKIVHDQSFDWNGEKQTLPGGTYKPDQFTSDSALTRYLVMNKSNVIEAIKTPTE